MIEKKPGQNTTLTRTQFIHMVVALTATQLIGTLTALLPPAIAPAIAAGHSLPVFMIGYQSAIMFAGMVVTLTVFSNAGTRWGACRAIQVGCVLMALGALLATSGQVFLLVIASLCIGMGYGVITPSNSHILRRFTPGAVRNIVFSIVQCGVPLGVIFAATAGPAVTVTAGWQWALWICSGLCGVLAFGLQPGRGRLDGDRAAQAPLAANPLKPVRAMWRLPALRRIALAGGTLIMSQVIIHSYTVAMFFEELSQPLMKAGLALTTAQVGAFLGRPFWGWLADRSRDCLGVLMVLAGIMAAIALISSTLSVGWSYGWSLVLFFFFGTTASGWHGAYLAEVARISPSEHVATTTSGVLVIIQLSSILTPILFATLFLATRSYSLSFGVLVIPAIASFFMLRAARSASGTAAF